MTDWQQWQPSPSGGPLPCPPGSAAPTNQPQPLPDLGDSGNLRRRFHQPIPVQAFAAFAVAAIIGTISGCSPTASKPAAAPSITSRATAATQAPRPGRTLTGFGATLAQWKAAHALDASVPARNAYLPHIDGEDTWQIVTATGNRVTSYTLNVPPSSLRAAEARARKELPADTRVLWKRTVPGTCSQEQLESATLAAVLGDGQVNVEFDNASTGTARPVTEELFSTYDAPTVAQAPAC